MSIGEFARLSRLSAKALRLYDELGLLMPEQVDPASGYRWYAPAQLRQAQLVASMRQIGMPLTDIKAITGLDPHAVAERLARYWAAAEAEHAARRALAGSLVAHFSGERSAMYEVATRDIPARRLLCLHQHVTPDQAVPVGRSFIARFRDGSVPRIAGASGALFVIYYGQVNDDSDGPVEWCRPVADADAAAVAAKFPDLTLRTEPAHEMAFAHLPSALVSPTEIMTVIQSLENWAAEHRRQPSGSLRQVFYFSPGAPSGNGPACDFAFPLSRAEPEPARDASPPRRPAA
ncbi:MAG TPA: helix-turn-helix domain-containing protein [Streptosporangiaceae bacterium]|jgi:DNA-binding transcriptional MerR regulator